MNLNSFTPWKLDIRNSKFVIIGMTIPILPLFVCFLTLFGCIQSTSSTDEVEKAKNQEISEPIPLAGSSSSTNWPPALGGLDSIQVQIKYDTSLQFQFGIESRSIELGAPRPSFVPVKISGKIIFYKLGPIPAIDSVPTISENFINTDSFKLPGSVLNSFERNADDTVYFSLRMVSDSLEAWVFNFGYAPMTNSYFKTKDSVFTENPIILRTVSHYFQGYPDSNTWLSKLPPSNKTTYSLYIPGTPFFWNVNADTISIGPIPEGFYPLRLLRITQADEGRSGSNVEVFALNCEKINPMRDLFYVFRPGPLITSLHSQKSISIRNLGTHSLSLKGLP
jgi:hypothetical protein